MLEPQIQILQRAAIALVCAGLTAVALAKSAEPAEAATRLELAIAHAAGKAAARSADRAVSEAVIKGAAHYRRPACFAGSRRLKLRSVAHAVFMRECLKTL